MGKSDTQAVQTQALQGSNYTPQSQTFNIFKGTQLQVATVVLPATLQKDSNIVTVSTTWDSKNYQLMSAQLVLNATQNAGDGAEVHAFLNGTDVAQLNWGAFDTSSKTTTSDISSLLTNGSNQYFVRYIADFIPPFTTESAVIDMQVVVTVKYIGTGGGVFGGGPISNPISSSTGPISPTVLVYAGIGVVGVILLAVVISVAVSGGHRRRREE